MIRKSLTLGTIAGSLDVNTTLIAKVLNELYVTPFVPAYVIAFVVADGRNS
jgi:hypothetical protein